MVKMNPISVNHRTFLVSRTQVAALGYMIKTVLECLSVQDLQCHYATLPGMFPFNRRGTAK